MCRLGGALLSHQGASASPTLHTLMWGCDHSCTIPGPPPPVTPHVSPQPHMQMARSCHLAKAGLCPYRQPASGPPAVSLLMPMPHHGLAPHLPSPADTLTQLGRLWPPVCGLPGPDCSPSLASWWEQHWPAWHRGAQHRHPGGFKSNQSPIQPGVKVPPQVLPPVLPSPQG